MDHPLPLVSEKDRILDQPARELIERTKETTGLPLRRFHELTRRAGDCESKPAMHEGNFVRCSTRLGRAPHRDLRRAYTKRLLQGEKDRARDILSGQHFVEPGVTRGAPLADCELSAHRGWAQ